jgi:excisionase family DNA binding protein
MAISKLSDAANSHGKLAYQINEAAQASGLSRSTLYQLIKTGELKSVKAAGRRLVLRNDLEAFLASRRDAA